MPKGTASCRACFSAACAPVYSDGEHNLAAGVTHAHEAGGCCRYFRAVRDPQSCMRLRQWWVKMVAIGVGSSVSHRSLSLLLYYPLSTSFLRFVVEGVQLGLSLRDEELVVGGIEC